MDVSLCLIINSAYQMYVGHSFGNDNSFFGSAGLVYRLAGLINICLLSTIDLRWSLVYKLGLL
jgi:hypothetical protein